MRTRRTVPGRTRMALLLMIIMGLSFLVLPASMGAAVPPLAATNIQQPPSVPLRTMGSSLSVSDVTPLVISHALDGNDEDFFTDIVIESDGTVHACGYTWESGLPVTGDAYQSTSNGRYDAFYGRWSPSDTLEYFTFFGGTLSDRAWGIDVDDEGYVSIVGYTESSNFPVTGNAYQGTNSSNFDMFLTVFNATGHLNYSTFIGGAGTDRAYDVVIDANATSWIVGSNERGVPNNFPTTANALNTSHNGGVGDSDIVLLALDRFGALTYSTFIGGTSVEQARSLVIQSDDGCGNVTVGIGALTASGDFPITSGAYDPFKASGNNWVFLRHNLTLGTADLAYSTFLGGGLATQEYQYPSIDYSATLDQFALAGTVTGNEFPDTARAPQASNGGGTDGFIAWFDGVGGNSGADLECATYLGGSADEHLLGVAYDSRDNVIVAGSSRSTDYPRKGLRSEVRNETTSRDVAWARYSVPESFGTTLNYSSCARHGEWAEYWGVDTDPRSDDARAVGLVTPTGSTGGEGRYELQSIYWDELVLPTEPHFNVTYQDTDVEHRKDEVTLVCNATRSTDLDGSQIDGVYLLVTDEYDGNVTTFEAEQPDMKTPCFYRVHLVWNSSGNYTWEFVAVTRDNGQESVEGLWEVNVTIRDLVNDTKKVVGAAATGLLDFFGQYGFYLFVALVTAFVLMLAYVNVDEGKYRFLQVIVPAAAATFMAVMSVAAVPGSWGLPLIGGVWAYVGVWAYMTDHYGREWERTHFDPESGKPQRLYQTLTLGVATVLAVLAWFEFTAIVSFGWGSLIAWPFGLYLWGAVALIVASVPGIEGTLGGILTAAVGLGGTLIGAAGGLGGLF